jgi:hypothetical protein
MTVANSRRLTFAWMDLAYLACQKAMHSTQADFTA